MESFSIEFHTFVAILFNFFSEDPELRSLMLTSFDWNGARLVICGEENMDTADTILYVIRENDGSETNIPGIADETNAACALFDLNDNPFSTDLQTYELVTIEGNDQKFGTASFSVNSTYMLLYAYIDLIS